MEFPPVFFKVRAVAFSCITSISLLWVILLTVEMFARWQLWDGPDQSLTVMILIVNSLTVLILPVLLLVEFRVWLDAARLLFLGVAHIGTASGFTYSLPQFSCPDQTADDWGVCQLFNVYTVMACWVIPAGLLAYTSYFAFVVYRQRHRNIPIDDDISPAQSQDRTERGQKSVSLGATDLEIGVRSPAMIQVVSTSNPSAQICLSHAQGQQPSPLAAHHLTGQRHLSAPNLYTASSSVSNPRDDRARASVRKSMPAANATVALDPVRRPSIFTVRPESWARASAAHVARSEQSSISQDENVHSEERRSRRSLGRLLKPLPAWYY